MLALNFQITHQVTGQTVAVNLAGRQRMLSQSMAKHIFAINRQQLSDKSAQENIMGYISAYDMFIDTLRAFKNSGYVIDAEKKLIEIQRIDDPQAQRIIEQTIDSVKPLHDINSKVLRDGLTLERYQNIRAIMVAINTKILHKMNQLTVIVQESANTHTLELRVIQLMTFLLALVNFAFIIYRFRRNNLQSEQTIHVLSDLIQSAKTALIIFDKQDRIIMSNEAAQSMFHYDEATMQSLKKSQVFNLDSSETMIIDSNGHQQPAIIHQRELIRETASLSIATIIEKSQYIENEQTLFTLANRNSLTGLLNQNALNQNALNTALYHKTQQIKFLGGRFACFYIQLDNYSEIANTHGQTIANDTLKELTYRLCSVKRDSDFIYHINGHEFVIITDLSDHEASLATITKKIAGTNYHSFNINDSNNIDVYLNIGAAVCPDDSIEPDTLLSCAKKRMIVTAEHESNQRDSQIIDMSKASKNRHR
ncbi:MAG: diguanylate cyclase domain-containing protein [Vibrio sp.]